MIYDTPFIESMKQKLLEEKSLLEGDLLRFSRPVDGAGNYEPIEEDLGNDMDDSATETEINDNNRSLETTLQGRLHDVLDALAKIESGTYGLCEKTGLPIPKERLEALPTARTRADA